MDMSAMVSHVHRRFFAAQAVFSGNLHLNVIANAYAPEIEAALEPFVYELVGAFHSTKIQG